MMKKDLDKALKSIYNCIYKESGEMLTGEIRWNKLKNIRLRLTRHISFEEIIQANLLGSGKNPGRNNQRVLVFECKSYTWIVPFVFEGKGIFLKTIYPSRKYKKLYKTR
ncbi:MAG: toxin [Candidatus Omnitrophica bacterium]|nr:toxin [Candidatus Omnitrophota bacterium]